MTEFAERYRSLSPGLPRSAGRSKAGVDPGPVRPGPDLARLRPWPGSAAPPRGPSGPRIGARRGPGRAPGPDPARIRPPPVRAESGRVCLRPTVHGPVPSPFTVPSIQLVLEGTLDASTVELFERAKWRRMTMDGDGSRSFAIMYPVLRRRQGSSC